MVAMSINMQSSVSARIEVLGLFYCCYNCWKKKNRGTEAKLELKYGFGNGCLLRRNKDKVEE